MSAELTEEQGAIREMALEFAQTKLTPYAREWDEKKSLPAEALPRAAAQGVGVTGSEALDGSGPADRSAAVNAGEIDISVGSIVGLCASIMGVCLEPICRSGSQWPRTGGRRGCRAVQWSDGRRLWTTLVGRYHCYTRALSRVAQIILKERSVNSLPDSYQQIGFGTIGDTPIPWSVILFVVLFLGFEFFLHLTHGGRAIYAIGNNREAARYSGVSVERAILSVFVASGMVCAVAAIVLTAYLASARSDTAIGLELQVVTAVVLGGVNIFGGSGTLVGVLIALFVLAFVKNALGLVGMTPEQQDIVTGAMLVGTLIIFGASRNVGEARSWFARLRINRP